MVSGLVEFVTFPGPREIPFPTLNTAAWSARAFIGRRSFRLSSKKRRDVPRLISIFSSPSSHSG